MEVTFFVVEKTDLMICMCERERKREREREERENLPRVIFL